MIRICCLSLLAASMATPKPNARSEAGNVSAHLEQRIQTLMAASPAVARGRVGFKFADADTGAVLAEHDATHFFTPASNAKLYTTALALVRLGPGYQFRTELRTSSAWHAGQDTVANLQIVGGGDPNLSGRALPYQVNAPEGDPLAALKPLLDKVSEQGIRCVTGDVTGVAGRYGGEAYPDGWTLDDTLYSYGAPVSALSLNDNSVSVIVRPTELGELADLELRPGVAHFVVQNQVTTDASEAAHVKLSRPPGSNEIILTGSIGQRVNQWREDVAVDDAALFTAEAFVDLLRERGITVGGAARGQYEQTNPTAVAGTALGEQLSHPLSEIAQVINKVSQNLHTEILLREVAFLRTGTGSQENGDKEREAFLNEAGISRDGTGYAIDDGSGLARQDLTTPDSTVALLRWMWARPERDVWVNTLPIGGLDGSLQHRFRNIAGAGRVRAKTGLLSHVNTLSGYIETREHGCIAFSIMVNGTAGHDADVRDFIDKLCALFLPL